MNAADFLTLDTLVGRLMRLARERAAGDINEDQAKAYAAELEHEFETFAIEGANNRISLCAQLDGRLFVGCPVMFFRWFAKRVGL